MIIFKYDKKSKRYDGIAQQHGEGTTLSVPWFENGFVTVFNETTKNWQLITEKEYYESMKPLGVDDDTMSVLREIATQQSNISQSINELKDMKDNIRELQNDMIDNFSSVIRSSRSGQDSIERFLRLEFITYLDRQFHDNSVRTDIMGPRGISNMIVAIYNHNRKPWYKRIFSRVSIFD